MAIPQNFEDLHEAFLETALACAAPGTDTNMITMAVDDLIESIRAVHDGLLEELLPVEFLFGQSLLAEFEEAEYRTRVMQALHGTTIQ